MSRLLFSIILSSEDLFISPINKISTKPESIALKRVLKHRIPIMKLNPMGEDLFDQPLRAALTSMIFKTDCHPKSDSSIGLRYLKDRISVPRDMPLLSARKLRQALETTAQTDGEQQGPPISTKNRFDQNPEPFINSHEKKH